MPLISSVKIRAHGYAASDTKIHIYIVKQGHVSSTVKKTKHQIAYFIIMFVVEMII